MLICLKRFLEIWRFLFFSKLFIHFHHVKIVLKSVVHRSINICFILRFLGHNRNVLFRLVLRLMQYNKSWGKRKCGFYLFFRPQGVLQHLKCLRLLHMIMFYKYWMLIWIAFSLYFWPFIVNIERDCSQKSIYCCPKLWIHQLLFTN